MDLNRVAVFVRVVETSSFTAAAHSLGFQYVSNETISYDVLNRSAVEESKCGPAKTCQ